MIHLRDIGHVVRGVWPTHRDDLTSGGGALPSRRGLRPRCRRRRRGRDHDESGFLFVQTRRSAHRVFCGETVLDEPFAVVRLDERRRRLAFGRQSKDVDAARPRIRRVDATRALPPPRATSLRRSTIPRKVRSRATRPVAGLGRVRERGGLD